MMLVTLRLHPPWSGSTSPMPCSKDGVGMSCVTCYLWKTLTASQVTTACHCMRVVMGNEVVGEAECKIAVKVIIMFPCLCCVGLGSPELHEHQP